MCRSYIRSGVSLALNAYSDLSHLPHVVSLVDFGYHWWRVLVAVNVDDSWLVSEY
jgi:hypothetical protein